MAFYLDSEDRQSVNDENPGQKYNLNYDIRMELDNSPIVYSFQKYCCSDIPVLPTCSLLSLKSFNIHINLLLVISFQIQNSEVNNV
jgi:hypothetical protein